MQLPFRHYDPLTNEQKGELVSLGAVEQACFALQKAVYEHNKTLGVGEGQAHHIEVVHASGEKRVFNLSPQYPGAFNNCEALLSDKWVIAKPEPKTEEKKPDEKGKK